MVEPKTQEVALVPHEDTDDEFKTVPHVGDLVMHSGVVYIVTHVRVAIEATRDQMGEGGSLQYNVTAEYQNWGAE
jgi:hypothetical protein